MSDEKAVQTVCEKCGGLIFIRKSIWRKSAPDKTSKFVAEIFAMPIPEWMRVEFWACEKCGHPNPDPPLDIK